MVTCATVGKKHSPAIYNVWTALGVLVFWGQGVLGTESAPVRLPPVDAQITESPPFDSFSELAASREITWRETRGTPSPLPLDVIKPEVRSMRLEQAAKQADLLTLKAYQLAGRGAFFAARAEFRAALVVLAQALDAENRTAQYSQMLNAAWIALQEARDFLPGRSNGVSAANLPEILARHDSPVLKHHSLDSLTPLEAYQIYLNFAQDLFSRAVGTEITGSMALRGLGKIHAEWKDSGSLLESESEAQAMVFYQAALNVWPGNYMAANDLGVLLARGGRWEDAVSVLEYARQIQPNPVVLANLAKLYRQKGLTAQASQLLAQASPPLPLGRESHDSRAQTVAWVPPEALRDTGSHMMETTRSESQFSAVNPETTNAATPSDSAASSTGRFPVLPFLKRGSSRPPANPLAGQRTDNPPGNMQTAFSQVGQGDSQGRQSVVNTTSNEQLADGVSLPNAASPCPRCAVDGSVCDPSKWGGWERARMIAWEKYAQGEYAGPARLAHVPEYRLRVDDELEIVYRITREETSRPYRLNVGDQLRVESATDPRSTERCLSSPTVRSRSSFWGRLRQLD